MAYETTEPAAQETGYHPWVAAAVAGLLAGVGMGVVLTGGTEILPTIGAIYGMETFVGGWLAHLFHSVVFALVFAAILSRPLVRHESFGLSTFVGIGIGYGAFLGLVTGGVIFPLAINASIDAGLPFPFVPTPGIETFATALVMGVSHLVYGAILGPVYALVSRSVPQLSV